MMSAAGNHAFGAIRPAALLGDVQAALALRGLLTAALGVLAIAWPGAAVSALVVVFGVYLLLAGIVLLIAAARVEPLRWIFALQGLACALVGLVALFHPPFIVTGAAYLIAVGALVTGVFEILVGIRMTALVPEAGLIAVGGVLSLFVAILLFRAPEASAQVVARLFGAYELAIGLLLLIAAGRLHQARGQAEVI